MLAIVVLLLCSLLFGVIASPLTGQRMALATLVLVIVFGSGLLIESRLRRRLH